MNSQLVHIVLILLILGTTAPAAAFDDDARTRSEIRRRRESVDDFYLHLERRADEERVRGDGADAASRRREIDEERRERSREAFVRRRVLPDSAEIEKRDLQDEKRIERDRARRDELRKVYVRQRNRYLRVLRQGRSIDQDLEFGLQDRDKNRVKKLKGDEARPSSGLGPDLK